jgi:hypothetical protein
MSDVHVLGDDIVARDSNPLVDELVTLHLPVSLCVVENGDIEWLKLVSAL